MDRSAEISKLLLTHRAVLYGYIFSCLRNHADAEDVLQEVALAVTKSFEKLRDSSEFLPWAREIARRQVLVHLRNANRTSVISPELAEVLADASDRVAATDDLPRRHTALLDCLDHLPADKRSLIKRRYDGSVSGVDELAQQLGRTMAATYGLIKRIRNELRECVERKMGVEARLGEASQ